jgi:3-dehydroquinate synthase II/3-amino-4-hydroxybenzoic acid synthase
LYLKNIDAFIDTVPARMLIILRLNSKEELAEFKKSKIAARFKKDKSKRLVVAYNDVDTLITLREESLTTCYECYVDDQESLHSSIYDGLKADYLTILFKDPTNIPLELVIASLQKTNTILMKNITDSSDVDDAIVTLGVMEYGAEGVIFSPTNHEILDNFVNRLANKQHPELPLQVGTVKATYPVGMGYRACIDTGTLFDDDEGILVGSTSGGGILCCPEVYFLPYMELRPFRVNAGAVHSYVYNVNDRTDYMSELKAGSSVMLVNSKGRVRTAPVGRMKIEQRPLRLIEVVFPGGEEINVIMQDDWHVRIFSGDGKPLNISHLQPGDKVMGYTTESGRHVGIKIDESIIEK